MAGFKRLFGVKALFQFGKGLAKTATVAGAIPWSKHGRIEAFPQFEPAATLQVVLWLSIQLVDGMLAAYVALALSEALNQRICWRARLRRS